MSFKSHFSHDVFHARTEKFHLTQEEVAGKTGISVREYQMIEKGDRIPGTEIFLRLIYFFELNIEDYREEILNRVSVCSH